MESYTAFLEVSAYLWLTITAVALGAVLALLTTPAASRRYPALFKERRRLAVLALLTLAVLALPGAIFIPGSERFPPLRELALYLGPVALVAGAALRFPRFGLPVVALALGALLWVESTALAGYYLPQQGDVMLHLEVRGVDAEGIDLLVEVPPGPAERWLGDEETPRRLERLERLSVTLEVLELHPYLWWRGGARGYRAVAPAVGSRVEEGEVSLLEELGGVRRRSVTISVPREDLLMSRYLLIEGSSQPRLLRASAGRRSAPEAYLDSRPRRP